MLIEWDDERETPIPVLMLSLMESEARGSFLIVDVD